MSISLEIILAVFAGAIVILSYLAYDIRQKLKAHKDHNIKTFHVAGDGLSELQKRIEKNSKLTDSLVNCIVRISNGSDNPRSIGGYILKKRDEIKGIY